MTRPVGAFVSALPEMKLDLAAVAAQEMGEFDVGRPEGIFGADIDPQTRPRARAIAVSRGLDHIVAGEVFAAVERAFCRFAA